jgi:hypothetical protein
MTKLAHQHVNHCQQRHNSVKKNENKKATSSTPIYNQ